jgi:hypothetical protein
VEVCYILEEIEDPHCRSRASPNSWLVGLSLGLCNGSKLVFMSIKLLTGKLKRCDAINAIHSKMPTISKMMIVHFLSPILKDEYVSHTSVYNGSCNHCVDTNRLDAPISRNLTTIMSILSNIIGSL